MVEPILRQARRSSTYAPSLLWRVPAAALVATAAAIHLYLWFDFFHRVHVVGVLFLVNAATGIAIAAAIAAGGAAPVLLAGLGYAAGTLAAFAISTTSGLFGFHERFWAPWQEAAGAVELTAIVVLAAALVRVATRG